MEIGPETRLGELFERYPYLIDYLKDYRPEFRKLANPLLRKSLGAVATVKAAAALGDVAPDRLAADIAGEVARMGGDGEVPQAARLRRQEELKGIIRDLHAGVPVADLKERFGALASEVGSGEIAEMEQALISEGMPSEEVKRLCDVHVEVFRESLEPVEEEPPPVPEGHPVDTFRRENALACETTATIRCEIDAMAAGDGDIASVAGHLDRLGQIDLHYLRKENQLFPLLERHGITGPTSVMWSLQDDIRALLQRVRKAAEAGESAKVAAEAPTLLGMIDDMVYKEEKILFPVSLETLSAEEWREVRAGEDDIGYAFGLTPHGEAPVAEVREHVAGLVPLTTGALSGEQVDLMLSVLPFDVSFVDETDTVRFYSEGERVFPRSPAVIGRKVQNCHPPTSLDKVQAILDAFRAGEKREAEFWIELGERFVHIRYFAMRDAEDRYRGTLELVQDATHLRGLRGQRRLLDW